LKLGLSTWSLLGLDVNSAVRTIGDAGFEYIELWGEVPHAYPDWTDKKRLRDTLSAYNMVITTHAPFTDLNPASPFQPMKSAVERTLEGFVKFSDFLGARMVTVHPGSVHNEAMVPESAQNSVSTLRRMVRAGGGRLSINVENQTKSRSKYHFPLASTFESLELILAEVEGSRFTLDTGHAHSNGQSPSAIAERVGAKLAEVHLNDSTGASDEHLIPGEGTADLKGVLERLAQTQVLVCLELDPHRYTAEQVMRGASEIKARLGAAPRAGV
jgi:sugar phosphate isomerase/epimerase